MLIPNEEDDNLLPLMTWLNHSWYDFTMLTNCKHPDNDNIRTKDVGLLLKNIKQTSSFLHDKKAVSSPVLITQQANRCFAGGLLGPDGNNKYLGKWCKQVQTNGSTPSSGGVHVSAAPSLIEVGAKGRGGRVKVLKHPNQTFAAVDVLKREKALTKLSL